MGWEKKKKMAGGGKNEERSLEPTTYIQSRGKWPVSWLMKKEFKIDKRKPTMLPFSDGPFLLQKKKKNVYGWDGSFRLCVLTKNIFCYGGGTIKPA